MAKYSTTDLRNVTFTGASGSGKTTLIETMLHNAGVIGRPGRVEDGNTVCDYEDIEKEFARSLNSALVHFDHGDAHLNIIDTPGGPDFIGFAICTMPAVETVAVVIDAHTGIDTVTRRMMKIARERNLPRVIVINKIDTATDPAELLANVQETFGTICRPINLPTDDGNVVDCFQATSGSSALGDVAGFHTALIDQIVEVDEELMEKYLEQGEVAPEQLKEPFKAALREGHLVPVCFTDARDNKGVTELMDFIAGYLPNPTQGNPRVFEAGEDKTELLPVADPDLPLIAHTFKVASDPYIGKLCVFRIHQGHVGSDIHPKIDDGKKAVRIAHVFKLQGKDHTEVKDVVAGDICAVSKLDEIHYDSVLHDGSSGDALHLKPLALPKPMFGLAIEGTSKGAETKMGEAMRKLTDEDPCLVIERVQATGETVMRGLGEQHLRVKLRLLKDRYGIEVATQPPTVPYKETITAQAEGHHRHKKQSGGAGQFGEVYLRVEPLVGEDAAEFEFVDDTFGGSVPKQFLPAIEKGVRQVLSDGAVAGYPMQKIKVSVYDGKYHPVDSKEVAFITAGKKAFVDAVKKARPVLLEPFVAMEISIPADMIGDISSDISGRRGRIQGTDMLPGNQCVLHAEAPLAEVMSYASQLKSISGGAGSYTMEYSHDEATPPNVQAEVIAKFRPKDDDD